jgi:hypothetical protein
MYATPVLILAAPAAGTSNVLLQALLRLSSGTAYSGGGMAYLQYGNSPHAGGKAWKIFEPNFLSTPSEDYVACDFVNSNGPFPSAQAMFVTNNSAAFTGGTLAGTLYLWYVNQ